MDTVERALERVSFLAGLSPSDRQEIAKQVEVREYDSTNIRGTAATPRPQRER